MADGKRQWFKKGDISFGNKMNSGGTGDHIKINKTGYQKSDGLSLVAQKVGDKRYVPGFTPNELYLAATTSAPNGWYGNLITAHIDSKDNWMMDSISIEENFNETNNSLDNGKPFSKRDTLLRFNDSRTDYFSHDLQIAGKTPFQSGDNDRYAFTNSARDNSSIRLDNFKESDFENQDPVVYGFEIIIDAVSSPLLNGSIDDFLDKYKYVSELQARRVIYYDFKTQFIKLFKTKGKVNLNPEKRPPYVLMSDTNTTTNNLNIYANSDIQSGDDIRRGGKVAYLSHYLQQIAGLGKLVEGNTSVENKYLVDYGKDTIKLSFFEDLTGSLSSLAHLYKMLYWSRPNGKGMIPENLLRFNCDIIVSECRNFNRIRKAIDSDDVSTGSLKVIKDNVSRHIYSLKECQFYFDKMPHDDSIDMGNITTYGLYEVNFDYKYSTSKYEKWIADPVKFGTYLGYNNGAIWKIGNKGSRETRKEDTANSGGNTVNIIETSVPRFYTKDTNTFGENGVNTEIILEKHEIRFEPQELITLPLKPLQTIPTVTNDLDIVRSGQGDESNEDSSPRKKVKDKNKPGSLDKFKENSKIVAKKAAKNVANFAIKEINQQITTRTALLNNTLNKIRNALGFGGLPTEPKNVYPKPYAPASFGIFFDVRNELFNFIGEDIASSLAGFNNILNPYKNPMNPTGNPLSSIVQKYGKFPSVYKNNTAYVGNTLNDIVKKFGKGKL